MNDGGQAFPAPAPYYDESGSLREPIYGMSLRDYFACKCRRDWDVQMAALFSITWAASLCYSRADAMLAERERRNDQARIPPHLQEVRSRSENGQGLALVSSGLDAGKGEEMITQQQFSDCARAKRDELLEELIRRNRTFDEADLNEKCLILAYHRAFKGTANHMDDYGDVVEAYLSVRQEYIQSLADLAIDQKAEELRHG